MHITVNLEAKFPLGCWWEKKKGALGQNPFHHLHPIVTEPRCVITSGTLFRMKLNCDNCTYEYIAYLIWQFTVTACIVRKIMKETLFKWKSHLFYIFKFLAWFFFLTGSSSWHTGSLYCSLSLLSDVLKSKVWISSSIILDKYVLFFTPFPLITTW